MYFVDIRILLLVRGWPEWFPDVVAEGNGLLSNGYPELCMCGGAFFLFEWRDSKSYGFTYRTFAFLRQGF